ncbi:MAG TPA: hypothetical protein DHW82_00165 [Spirochaetia bacterium]|nr:MAG: hypothetical protein A2Y41_02255 [Spirochaetes bacterium GWB1_36_13]HCL55415.1 hypothetical protein [Spirochaetia bacterium]
MIGILYLSIGDSAAAIGGIYLSKKIPFKIPKTQKTFIGSFSFFAVASVIGFLMGLPILTVFISAFTGALFEAVPIGIDDNFSIPLSSCSVIWLMSCAGSVFQKICY